jgi:hypothetical protein
MSKCCLTLHLALYDRASLLARPPSLPCPQKLRAPRGKGAADVVFTEAPRFNSLLRPREYVTCDAESRKDRFFVCKSVLVEDGPLQKAAKGHVRANLLFAMRVSPALDSEGRPGASHLQVGDEHAHQQGVDWRRRLCRGHAHREAGAACGSNAETATQKLEMRRLCPCHTLMVLILSTHSPLR